MLTVIGEALIDEVVTTAGATTPHVGGSPLNVAVGLARLDHPVQFLGRIGLDAYGEMIASHLRDNSVLLPVIPDSLPTSIARARPASDGQASYEFELDWDLPALAPANGAVNFMLAATSLVHTGSIASMLEPGADQVHQAILSARPHSTISFDPNCRPSIITNATYAREQAEKFVALADVVKASDEDLHWLYPDQDPIESARNWLAKKGSDGPGVVVVTQGQQGAWAICAAGEVSVPAPKAAVVDTVGAGDSFMAALLSALVDRELDGAQRRGELRAMSSSVLHEVVEQAVKAAAVTVSRAGANPPNRHELR